MEQVPTAITKFVDNQKKCVKAEQEDEIRQVETELSQYSRTELNKRGIILLNLVNTKLKSGLNGTTILEFEDGFGNELNSSKFRVGDVVQMTDSSSKAKTESDFSLSGVVVRVDSKFIAVSTKDELKGLPDRFMICKLANSISYNRMLEALDNLAKDSNPSQMIRVLFNLSSPTIDNDVMNEPITYLDDTLNDSQKMAVRKSLAYNELFLIHGPPGTGKTHTCVEVIRQLAARKKRILVCGPSNISVDNLVERLGKTKLDIIRLGHPARVLNSVLHHTLDYRLSYSDQGQIVIDVRKDIDDAFKSLKKSKRKADRHKIYQDIKDLRSELRNREKTVLREVLDNAQVILTTLNGAASHLLKNQVFDVVLIDEASQALEAECYIAITKGTKLLLAGDHLQLPPTIKSQSPNVVKVLEQTLFERSLKNHGESIKELLNIQYRMNDLILGFSSRKFYDGKVKSGDSISTRTLTDLKDVQENDLTTVPLIFIDTAGAGFEESTTEDDSKLNTGEAQTSFNHVQKLIQSGVPPDSIAVISPYNGQVTLLKSLFQEHYPEVELGTVDGFQGREKEAIIFTMVRSNTDGEVGFLAEDRRLNVALTRPKRQLCVVGDSQTMNRNKFLKDLVDYLEENAIVTYPDND